MKGRTDFFILIWVFFSFDRILIFVLMCQTTLLEVVPVQAFLVAKSK